MLSRDLEGDDRATLFCESSGVLFDVFRELPLGLVFGHRPRPESLLLFRARAGRWCPWSRDGKIRPRLFLVRDRSILLTQPSGAALRGRRRPRPRMQESVGDPGDSIEPCRTDVDPDPHGRSRFPWRVGVVESAPCDRCTSRPEILLYSMAAVYGPSMERANAEVGGQMGGLFSRLRRVRRLFCW